VKNTCNVVVWSRKAIVSTKQPMGLTLFYHSGSNIIKYKR